MEFDNVFRNCHHYRKAAGRASLLYFILNDLFKINPMYQFSLKAYSVVFKDALANAEVSEDLDGRVRNLLDSITFSVFVYTSRGLFERDKLVFLFLITLQVSNFLVPFIFPKITLLIYLSILNFCSNVLIIIINHCPVQMSC